MLFFRYLFDRRRVLLYVVLLLLAIGALLLLYGLGPMDIGYCALIALVLRSAARLCVIPLQDYLGLNNHSRMNKPSTVGTNWLWRLQKADLSSELQRNILRSAVLYGRAEQPCATPVPDNGNLEDL